MAILTEPGPEATDKQNGRSDTGLISLLRLMYDSYVLFHGTIKQAMEVSGVSWSVLMLSNHLSQYISATSTSTIT